MTKPFLWVNLIVFGFCLMLVGNLFNFNLFKAIHLQIHNTYYEVKAINLVIGLHICLSFWVALVVNFRESFRDPDSLLFLICHTALLIVAFGALSLVVLESLYLGTLLDNFDQVYYDLVFHRLMRASLVSGLIALGLLALETLFYLRYRKLRRSRERSQ